MRVVIYYAVWATVCAAVAGVVVLLLDTFLLSNLVRRAAVFHNLIDEGVGILAIAAGQGAVALVTGSALVGLKRDLNATVLLGLLVGVFDFLFDLLQVTVPALEVEWVWKLVVSLVAALAITAIGGAMKSASAA
ncbi:MAG TPA: hypothetical protein VFK78_01655 [Gemmatimonadales bacterium]|nr:hypothetical protein [Gemmatimonadales bacterium]